VQHHVPFPVLRVGCQVHTVAHWREHWREIAEREGVYVSEAEVEAVFALIANGDA